MGRRIEASTHIGRLIHQGLVSSGLEEQRRLAEATGLTESFISRETERSSNLCRSTEPGAGNAYASASGAR